MDNEVPDYLFHYTTIETLALILKNKTFRFTRLSNLNDPLEGKGHNFKQAEHFVFSSSWTVAERDTIPMWKMYSDLKGVRLKFPGDLFVDRADIHYGPWGGATFHHASLSEPVKIHTTEPILGENNAITSRTISGPDPVRYLADGKLTETERIVYGTPFFENAKDVLLGPVGLYKNDDWEFEEEWRFRFLPWVHLSAVNSNNFDQRFESIQVQEHFVDIPILDAAFDRLEVMLGPKSDVASEVIVKALIEKFAPKAQVLKSEILVV